MAKNLDELVKDAPVIPEPPMVRDTPEGWPSFFTMEGETWYQRALAYKAWSGHDPLPLDWEYDEDWNVVPAKKVEADEEPDENIPVVEMEDNGVSAG